MTEGVAEEYSAQAHFRTTFRLEMYSFWTGGIKTVYY